MIKVITARLAALAVALVWFVGSSKSSAAEVVWSDDSVPAGAVQLSGGDNWNWTSSNPTPAFGSLAHQSNLASGLHEHFFNYAGDSLSVNQGEVLFAYVFIDPANVPTELMLSWNADGWEHRAYWGANTITYGNDGTNSRRSMGALPAKGQWVRLEVPASQVGLEGKTITGMGFSQYGGRATWDRTGKASAATPAASTSSSSSSSAASTAGDKVWVDDAIPSGAVAMDDGKDSWKWVTALPSPAGGTAAHQSANLAGLHEHFFNYAGDALAVGTGEVLFTYVYLDPVNTPTEIMLAWNSDGWEHRAYWGNNSINYGTESTVSRRSMGALPATGQWVRLEVSAAQVGLEGKTVTGMGFSTFGGRATWDKSGKTATASSSTGSTTPVVTTPTTPATTTTTQTVVTDTVWVDDAVPAGAQAMSDGKDSWSWVNSPSTSGASAHQSGIASGLHEHWFNYAQDKLTVGTGDVLFTYVYLDAAHIPDEVMLAWNADGWEHRAYWGANSITYGTDSTDSRRSMGGLPAVGQWVRLEVPASQVGLEGKTITGMGFSTFGGRATWDKSGKGVVSTVTVTTPVITVPPVTTTPSTTDTTPSNPVVTTPVVTTPVITVPDTTTPVTVDPTQLAAIARGNNINGTTLQLAQPGDNLLQVLNSNLLELKLINLKPAGSPVTVWNFVDSNGNMQRPATSKFTVTVNGQTVGVQSVGFKRRVAYAPLQQRDLRVENALYLTLSSPIADGQLVTVTNPDGSLWSSSTLFSALNSAQRFSPAIHVNQEGYVPSMPKKAMVGYYLGDMGEMNINGNAGFALINTATGAEVYRGALTLRADSGYNSTPAPYQKVYQADFSDYAVPGEYRLQVFGLGVSLPFVIDDGIAMGFARTYALGLYHQRCGADEKLPYTRFEHDACHTAPAQVPVQSDSQFTRAWQIIASYGAEAGADNPAQIAPKVTSEANMLFPFINKGTLDVTGGHHDAGDYSKYTINSAELTHYLMFTADSVTKDAKLDNLGIPESGDGIPDVLQEAKWEADYLAKIQDADGGFYFLLYPKDREYEGNVMPDKGDKQIVWPKNTSVTAASVAALAECASSPQMKQYYPADAARYMAAAKKGWDFVTAAINKYGKAGAYQKLTFYSDHWTHDDELAWAAAAMFAATGDQQYQQKLFEWFPNPSDSNTFRWGWWRMAECWGNAIRTYAFAVRSGRLPAGSLNPAYLAQCELQIVAAGDDVVDWGQKNAYGTPFPIATKRVNAAGWYFSLDQVSDVAVAYQIQPKPAYVDVLLTAMNYEAGTNPLNVTYLTGLGLKRQHEIVSQYAQNDRRVLPPTGIPLGNIQAAFDYLPLFGAEPSQLSYPSDNASTNPYPFYDRWSDAYNVTTEYVAVNQARSMLATGFLATKTASASRAWKTVPAQIALPVSVAALNTPLNLTVTVPGQDMTGARIVWEARDQEPSFGTPFTLSPKNAGPQWVEAEIEWPDGRRAFASGTFQANSPVVTWVEDAIPNGGTAGSDGGDGWNWIGDNVKSGKSAQQSNVASGLHEHWFTGATATMEVSSGDTMFAWVYIDPANKPSEIMLMWTDGSSWDHRAFWGSDKITYGTAGTAGRYRAGDLPAAGGWVKLTVPASAVGLEGKTVNGMAFSLFDGRATWDAAGKASASAGSN